MAYVIGSQKGKDKAESMQSGETWVNTTDGSTWVKNSDGSVSVTHNGQTTNNAYSPTSTGTSTGGGTGGTTTGTTTKTYKPTGTYNDADLPYEDRTQIDYWKQQYNDAIARGDREAADLAHQQAELIRQRYNYSGGIDGSSKISLGYDVPKYEYPTAKPIQSQTDPRINQLLNQILSREDFSYDVANDPLYQQYAQMYQREGDRAMKETLAEAASGAGGMNTYAITAAQQANSYYNSQLNDKIPELYQLAYQMYLQDKDSMVQDLGLLQGMDETQYSRYRDTMSDYYNDRNFAYGIYRDDVGDAQWNKTFDYNSMQDSLNFSNNNYWANKEWDANREDVEYNRTQAEKESAKEEIAWYIENGVTAIPADLIAKSGLDQNAINQMITNYQLKQTAKGASSGGGGGSKVTKEDDKGDDNGGEPTESGETAFDRVSYSVGQLSANGNVKDAVTYLTEAYKSGHITIEQYRSIVMEYRLPTIVSNPALS